ncbi:CHAP domain-containing protein [Nocardia cyriacigeorgica]|uniref:CHAP domain-containing protein n=1 Tax=Nocardia cyriacigeorgica TaxID=135487 RepID=A0A6P1DAS2_9NOCA|nr:CHAP domain-containing protein [Nocardia cyriacigeorgica]NEW40232.1 CHAP domain-containing protein [Nocardia cyriacigeorgica]NEW46651.1 CHAP domain-containing protein [Nocardia cyriacigeorgica]NEW50821.1 CHAP domain-containing protein [Nocardia cyriacigeorgica]NEW58957.1 CHAP domain-containing protein [Nocardia cyriacigeorgica]
MAERGVTGVRTRRRGLGPVGWVVVGAVIIALVVASLAGVRWWQERSPGGAVVGESLGRFPEIDTSALTPQQAQVVAVLEREFSDPGDGPKYADGITEPWCADFVSWVMREAGAPLSNPHSGSWRIPGVYTLQEYYESAGRFVPIDAEYQPRAGDVLLYSDSSPFTQHTNIVLSSENGVVTTIGGNEFGTVRIHRFTLAEVPGVVGYGRI